MRKIILFLSLFVIQCLILRLNSYAQVHFKNEADSLFNAALEAYRMEDYDTALKLYINTSEKYSSIGDHLGSLNARIQAVNMRVELNQIEGAADSLSKLKSEVESLENQSIKYEFYSSLGYLEFEKGNIKVADSLFNLGLNTILMSSDSSAIANAYSDKAFIQYYLMDYDGSYSSAAKSLSIYERLGDKFKMSVLNNIIHINMIELNNYDQAFFYIKNSLDLAYQSGSPMLIKNGHRNISDLHLKKGRIDSAVNNLKIAAEMSITNNQTDFIRLNKAYAGLLFEVGRIKESIQIYKNIIEKCLLYNCNELGNIYSRLAAMHLRIGYIDESKVLFEKADSLFNSASHHQYNTHQIQYGRYLLFNNQVRDARIRAQYVAQDSTSSSSFLPSYGYILLSEIEKYLMNHELSLAHAQKAYDLLPKEHYYNDVITEVTFSLARAYSDVNVDSALHYGFKALNPSFISDQESFAYNSFQPDDQHNDALNELISWYIQSDRSVDNAIQLMQIVKNRYIRKYFSNTERTNNDLYANLLINDLTAIYSNGIDSQQNGEPSILKSDLSLLQTTSSVSDNYDILSPVKSLQEIQSAIDEETAIIEYGLHEYGFMINVITKESQQFYKKGVQLKNELNKNIADHIKVIRDHVMNKSKEREFESNLIELYSMLIKPIEKRINGKKKLIIIPDGPLLDLPFELLKDDASEYFIEKFVISYLYSTSMINNGMHLNKANKKNMYAYAATKFNNNRYLSKLRSKALSPLPFANIEIDSISARFSKKLISKNDPYSEDYIKRTGLSHFTHIHFATHGILNEQNPNFSKLILTDDLYGLNLTNDGHLTALEVGNLDITADLVVLSACDTGNRYGYTTSSSMSMQKAFILAGAKGVVGTSWPVYDQSTKDFMILFYDEIMKNENERNWLSFFGQSRRDNTTPAEALYKVKNEFINHPFYSHPVYWAGYTYVGN